MVRFIKAAIKIRPQIHPIFRIWDFLLGLRELLKSLFAPDLSSPLYYLTLKTDFLTAIVSTRRISDIAAFSCKEPYCTFFSGQSGVTAFSKFFA